MKDRDEFLFLEEKRTQEDSLCIFENINIQYIMNK